MTEYSWARVLEEMPEYLFNFSEEDEPRNGNGIRLRDAATGYEVLFYVVGDEAQIKVPVPADPDVRDRLVSVLRSHRKSSVMTITSSGSSTRTVSELARWNPEPLWVTQAEEAAEEWSAEELARPADRRAYERVARRPETALQWRTYWPDDPTERSRIAAAVIEVLRDGLGATPARLRYSTFDDAGPVKALYGITRRLTSIAPDRPSDRGAVDRCVDWLDFVERFEWVLTTLPKGALLTLSAPGADRDKCFVQFVNHNFAIANESVMWQSAGLTRDEFHQRMTRLGWKWAPQQAHGVEHPGWIGPRVRHRQRVSLGDAAQRTAATFRDVLGVAGPSEITFASWGAGAMSYLKVELGLARRDS
ncbi:hypothetical protein ACFVAV_10535 [Nocardia sp. NPDC057663]|uniref:TY-Chap domain-containing protein n=1 Tax=Nocardia sp. NPDC057663 TaxID=3346201 RepID=UPI00366C4B41